MDYFDVMILNSSAVYEVQNNDGSVTFTDANGVAVDTPVEPIKYVSRSWCTNRPSWMEQLPTGQ